MTFIGFDGFGELLTEWHTNTHYQIRPEVDAGGDTKRQFRILLVTLKTYWTKKHGFLVFCGL